MRRSIVLALGVTALASPIWPAPASAAPPAAGVPQRAVVPMPAPTPVADDQVYQAAGRRDPFRPPRVGAGVSDTQTPLQRYEIGQLRLVAIIYNTQEPRAVVEDDAGLGYIVKVGTPIGTNGGAVRAIEKGRVLVREDAEDFYGESQASEVVLELTGGNVGRPAGRERGRR
jgi:type IV pilus assembly protein PilP